MLRLSDKAIEDFQAIWKKEFSEEISKEFAELRGSQLIELMKVLIRKPQKKSKTESNSN